MSLAAAETWMVGRLRDALGDRVRGVEPGPGVWSDAYLKRIVAAAPGVYVVWQGGDVRASTHPTLDSRWAVYVVTGWKGGAQPGRDRRQTLGYLLLTACVGVLHNAFVPDVGRVRVARVDNHWSGTLDEVGLALYGATLELPIVIDVEADLADLDDFRRAGLGWDLAGGAPDADARDVVTLPGAESV